MTLTTNFSLFQCHWKQEWQWNRRIDWVGNHSFMVELQNSGSLPKTNRFVVSILDGRNQAVFGQET